MKLKYNIFFTAKAQNLLPTGDIDAVFDDHEFIVERHLLLPPHPKFQFRLVIKRRDGKPIGDWRTLQDAKNQAVGPEREAVQVFPPESEVTDTANLYHLWVFRSGCSAGLRIERSENDGAANPAS